MKRIEKTGKSDGVLNHGSSAPKIGRWWNPWTEYTWRQFGTHLQFAILFLLVFLVTDGSSTASQNWEGAPPVYVPVGLSLALLLWGGNRYAPLVFVSSIIAAKVNYH